MSSVEGLENELMCLCEVRGELSDADNARVEQRIAEIVAMLEKAIQEAA
jgi:hypothetical protein